MAMACSTVSSPIKPSWPTTTTSCGMKQYFNRYKLSWISENTNMFQAQIMHRTKCKCKCRQDGLLCHKAKLVPDKKYFWQFHYFRQGELTIQKTLQLPIGLFPPSLTSQNITKFPTAKISQAPSFFLLNFGGGIKVFPAPHFQPFLSHLQITTLASKLHKGGSKFRNNFRGNINPNLLS